MRRGWFEMVHDALLACSENSIERKTLTALNYKAGITPSKFSRLMQYLAVKELIILEQRGTGFVALITEKGYEWLKRYDRLERDVDFDELTTIMGIKKQ